MQTTCHDKVLAVTLCDLWFLASVLFELALLLLTAVRAMRRQWDSVRRSARLAGGYLAVYAIVLIAVSLVMPRRFLAPGERRCFDDWCVTALAAERNGHQWLAALEISSVAKRVHQRARDAEVEMEDLDGRRYRPCGAPIGGRRMTGELAPGESFQVTEPFCLPRDAQPAGLVIRHGAFPGVLIIGDDQSFLHPPALARVNVSSASR